MGDGHGDPHHRQRRGEVGELIDLPRQCHEEDPVPDSLTHDVLWLVMNRRFSGFRALLCPAPPRNGRFPLLPHAAAALGVKDDDSVRVVPLAHV